MNTKISVVLVNWNGLSMTVDCLDSLRKIKKGKYIFETIVVDNGSKDDSVKVISEKYPEVILLKNSQNLGFAGGCNTGIIYALGHKSDIIWLLNNDTIVEPDALLAAGAFASDKVAAVGSKIFFAPGYEFHRDRYQESDRGKVIWYAGGIIDWKNMYAFHRGVDEIDSGQFDSVEDTDFVTGCSMWLSAKALRVTGLLDDKLYLYLEDLDLCLRFKKDGYQIKYVPDSMVWHRNAGSSGGSGSSLHVYYQTRNRLVVGLKYAPLRTKLALIREGLRFVVKGDKIRRQAIIHAICGKMGNSYEQPQK